MPLLKDYVYKNIAKYGNSMVMRDFHRKHGDKKIIADLNAHGFINVVIRTNTADPKISVVEAKYCMEELS